MKTTKATNEQLLDAAASIRLAASLVVGDLAELETQRDEIERVLVRAAEKVEAVAR